MKNPSNNIYIIKQKSYKKNTANKNKREKVKEGKELSEVITDKHKLYRDDLAKKLRETNIGEELNKLFTGEELTKFSPEQLKRLKSSLKQDILEEAQQTNEYKEARNAKRKKREVSQKELADILASKGFNETKIETIVLGNDTENATEVLKAKLEILVKNKTLKNYPGAAIGYLNSIYQDNEIFTTRPEKDRVKFLKRVIGWIKNPENIEGVHFGEERTEGYGMTRQNVRYYNCGNYNSNDYNNHHYYYDSDDDYNHSDDDYNHSDDDYDRDYDRNDDRNDDQNNTEIIGEMIKKITNDRTNGRKTNVPELAFLPLILSMSSGLFDGADTFADNNYFYLRIAKYRRMSCKSKGGNLSVGYNENAYPARVITQVS